MASPGMSGLTAFRPVATRTGVVDGGNGAEAFAALPLAGGHVPLGVLPLARHPLDFPGGSWST